MPSRIAIYCCNNLFSEGIKRLLEEDGMGINYRITVSKQEEVLNAKPDILITDFIPFPCCLTTPPLTTRRGSSFCGQVAFPN